MKPSTLIATFLTGVISVLPLVVTAAVVIWIAGILKDYLGPQAAVGSLLQNLGLKLSANEAVAYVIGWLIVLAVIFAVGVVVELGAKRFLETRIDGLAKKVPILGSIYGTVRQFAGMSRPNGDIAGMSVVFCIFGKETGASFLALMPTPEKFHIDGVDYQAVIIPTAPVPFGGSLLFVPASSVKPANISVDALMSIYVSMGVSGPQFLEAYRTASAS
jgi:uncharacterized membrane protein